MTSKDTNPKDAIGTAKWRQFMTVPRQVLWEVGVGMLEGALKYGRHNYRGAGVRASVYLDAAYGHLDQFCEGEDIDKDSNLSHVTKAICSLVVLRDAMMNDFWVDDRPPKIKDLDGLRDHLQEIVTENFDRHADKNPHHYTEVEDPAPYRDTGGVPWFGVNVEREVMRSPEFANMVEELRKYPDVFKDGPRRFDLENAVWAAPEIEDVTDEEDSAHRMFESLFGSFPDGYTMKTERVGDIEITTIAPDGHDWNASDSDLDDQDILAQASGSIELTLADLQPGNTHQYRRNHNGTLVKNGGIWKVKGRPLGVKSHYSPAHRGIPLAQGWWIQVATGPDDLEAMQRQFAHAQSSASVTPPILGLSSHALALLDEWRTAEGHEPFPAETPELARALALRQWAVMRGIISHD